MNIILEYPIEASYAAPFSEISIKPQEPTNVESIESSSSGFVVDLLQVQMSTIGRIKRNIFLNKKVNNLILLIVLLIFILLLSP